MKTMNPLSTDMKTDLPPLDAEVAEKVIGITLNYVWRGKPRVRRPEEYSRNITLAMEVVAKMKQEGWLVTINDDGDTWCVEFHVRNESMGMRVDAEHESLSTAICLAALEVKGVKV